MSRIGQKSIAINKKLKIDLKGKSVKVSGPKGVLEYTLPKPVDIEVTESSIKLTTAGLSKKAKALHGLSRSLLNNMVRGVDTGFKKELEIQGIGYRAQVSGKKLVLNIGYSHPVEYPIPKDVSISVTDATKILVEGIDKQRVGQVAAIIRQFRKPEPYKGKGIRYAGEYVAMKEGKTV